MKMDYEAIIGLEIHLQLNCATKMFCDCPNQPGDEPNRNTCPICLWLPGALPKFGQEALEKAVLSCLALHCDVQRVSAFDQKVYYYPDLPKGFQLSQFHLPLARGGWLEISGEDGSPKRLRLRHIHMEEDVARLVHETEGRTPISLVDFNRAGAPLIEIVTEPDMRGPHDAMEFVRALRTQLRYAGTSDCSLEQGTMRVDANISLRPRGSDELRTKVEVKNMNSIRSVGDAVAYEIGRQEKCLRTGEPIVLHTRLWNTEKAITTAMRSKFEGPCVPDPSVPRIVITDEWLEEMRSRLSEMPAEKIARLISQYGLTGEEAALIGSERELSEYFERVMNLGAAARTAVHWIATQLLPALKERNLPITENPVTPERFAGLLALLKREEINANSARKVLLKLFDSDRAPEKIVEQDGFRQVSDTAELESIIDRVITENPSAVADFRGGEKKAIGFLIGQAMQLSRGKANPRIIRKMLLSKL